MPIQKHYTVKVYDPTGATLLGTFAPGVLRNTPQFRSRIDGGLGELRLDLALPFDDFGEGTAVGYMNVVDVHAVDAGNPRGRRIYRGFVSRYCPYARGSDQGVELTCLGLGSLLTLAYYPDTSHAAQDPESICHAVIDHFNTVYAGSLITYSGDTTDPVGSAVTHDFDGMRWAEAIGKAHELSGTGWWWKVDADGLFWLKARPSAPTHTFTIGRDVESFAAVKDSEKVVNYLELAYALGTATYQDAASIAAHGRRGKKLSEATIPDLATADRRGEKLIGDQKDPKTRAELTINAEYDLESIAAGDTCRVRNFRKGSTLFADNLQVVALDYRGDTCRLQLEEASDLGTELDAFVNG